uniref:Ribophorin 2 family protein n=1 Tax=Rhizophora mucronata TaxID=61149 RepID=A0A2P2LYJ8_RHIMU
MLMHIAVDHHLFKTGKNKKIKNSTPQEICYSKAQLGNKDSSEPKKISVTSKFD